MNQKNNDTGSSDIDDNRSDEEKELIRVRTSKMLV